MDIKDRTQHSFTEIENVNHSNTAGSLLAAPHSQRAMPFASEPPARMILVGSDRDALADFAMNFYLPSSYVFVFEGSCVQQKRLGAVRSWYTGSLAHYEYDRQVVIIQNGDQMTPYMQNRVSEYIKPSPTSTTAWIITAASTKPLAKSLLSRLTAHSAQSQADRNALATSWSDFGRPWDYGQLDHYGVSTYFQTPEDYAQQISRKRFFPTTLRALNALTHQFWFSDA